MKREPKLVFKDDGELMDCLSEWKHMLGLSDWMIGARICPKHEMLLDNASGESEVHFIERSGIINICRVEDLPPDMLLKQPMEMILIHELLHFKFVSFDDESREEALFELTQHQLIETLARALYMAKYNLKPSWFVNDAHRYERSGK